MGTEGSRIFDANPASEKIDTASYNEYSKAVKEQFQPTISVAAACYEFSKRDQGQLEPADAWLAALRTLAADCGFGEQTDRQVAIRLIGGCQDKDVQVRLLTLQKIDLQEVFSLIRAEELAKENAATMQHQSSQSQRVAAIQQRLKKSDRRTGMKPKQSSDEVERSEEECSRCGYDWHSSEDARCPARSRTCNRCNRLGHLASKCRTRDIKIVYEGSSALEVDPEAVLNTIVAGKTAKMKKSVSVSNGVRFIPTCLELNTAADVTTITKGMYDRICPKLPLKKPDSRLKNFDRSNVTSVVGCIDTKLKVDGKVHRDVVYVVSNASSAVLGKNFLVPMKMVINCGRVQPGPGSSKTASKMMDVRPPNANEYTASTKRPLCMSPLAGKATHVRPYDDYPSGGYSRCSRKDTKLFRDRPMMSPASLPQYQSQ